MAARKKAVKKRTRKKPVRSRSTISKSQRPIRSLAHKNYTEKMIITAVISIVIIGFIVWFSQDFPAEGQAYQIQLELEENTEIVTAILTSCQTTSGCEYVLSVIDVLEVDKVFLDGIAVDPYQLVYYGASGEEITGVASGNLAADGVVTIGHLGTRYTVNSFSI